LINRELLVIVSQWKIVQVFFSSFLKGQGPIQKERDDGTTQSDVHFANIKLRVKIKIKKATPQYYTPQDWHGEI